MGGNAKLIGKHAVVAEKMLHDIAEVLASEKIPYVLEGGTLLGVVRESRLLPWDTDMDLTITRCYAKTLLAIRWKFWLKGYRARVRLHKEDTPHFKKGSPRLLVIQTRRFFFFKKDRLMDIFIKDLVDDRYFWMVSEKKKVLKSTPRHYYENITQHEFKGKMYNIPRDYDAYLQSRYGEWRTPKETWDYSRDDLSIEKT